MSGTKTVHKWWLLASVAGALFMIMLQGIVLNVAIERIISDLNATFAQVQWISNAYLITFTSLMLTFGRLGDEFGRKKLFLGGLAIYMLGSLLCGISSSIDQIIGFSVLQGFGAAAMMPGTLSLIAANFEKHERGIAMGVWGAISGLATAVAPILGGVFVDWGLGSALNQFLGMTQTWRYIYFLNLFIGVFVLIMGLIFIPESKDSEKQHRIDFLGVGLSSLAIFLLTYGFIEASKYGWLFVKEDFSLFGWVNPFGQLSVIPVIFVLSILLIVLFVWRESRIKKDPLLDVKFFKNVNFSVGTFIAAVLNFAMMGTFFLLPMFLEMVLGFSAIDAGLTLIPMALTIIVISPIAGKLSDKFGSKWIIFAGMIILGLGIFVLAHFTTHTTQYELILPLILIGAGIALPISPLNNAALMDIPIDEMGGASGALTMIRQLGSIMGIAVLGFLFQTAIAPNVEREVRLLPREDITNAQGATLKIGIPQSIQDQIIEGFKKGNRRAKGDMMPQNMTMMYSPEDIQLMKDEIGTAIKTSFVGSINSTFIYAVIAALFGALITLLMRSRNSTASVKPVVILIAATLPFAAASCASGNVAVAPVTANINSADAQTMTTNTATGKVFWTKDAWDAFSTSGVPEFVKTTAQERLEEMAIAKNKSIIDMPLYLELKKESGH